MDEESKRAAIQGAICAICLAVILLGAYYA
jgi:hypothetical protein